MPKISRIAFLVNPDNPYILARRQRILIAADAIGLQSFTVNLNAGHDITNVFAKMKREGAQAVMTGADCSVHAYVTQGSN